MPILFILFIAIPLVELYFLFQVGDIIGGFNTIMLIIVTAMAGSYFIRQQGIATFLKAQQNMQQGQLPAMEMLEGLVLVIAGVMLVTPGFITDSFGFILLVPPIRRAFVTAMGKKMIVRQNSMRQQPPFQTFDQSSQQQAPGKVDDFIEGEFTKDDK